MSEFFEITLRWIFGLQMIFWGLNGFFNWIKIPPASSIIDNFVAACVETRFIMPTVKFAEIILGAFLLAGFLVPLSLIIFAPIIFIVTALHTFHNPKPWGVLLGTSLPFGLLLLIHSDTLLRLVH